MHNLWKALDELPPATPTLRQQVFAHAERIEEELKSGRTLREISRVVGINYQTLHSYMRSFRRIRQLESTTTQN
ncbi:MAG: hypothetical protein ACK5X0_20050 [Rhodospirillales bacterium]|jgi:DNA-binding CsgD family transcriptional regulator